MKYIPWVWLGAYVFVTALFTALGVPYGPVGGLLVALLIAPAPSLIHAGITLLHYRMEYVPVLREGQQYVERGSRVRIATKRSARVRGSARGADRPWNSL